MLENWRIFSSSRMANNGASTGVRWIESRSFVSYDGNGQPERAIGVNIDVTQREQTDALLTESNALLADAMAAGQVMASNGIGPPVYQRGVMRLSKFSGTNGMALPAHSTMIS